MKDIKPFSAIYYVKENGSRVAICIFILFLATGIFLAGNYISSFVYMQKKSLEYSDKLVSIDCESTDVDWKDFENIQQIIKKDNKLKYVMRSSWGFGGMSYKSVLGLEMGVGTFVFNSVSDMENVFERLGVKGDFSKCKNKSIVISQAVANSKGLKLGDKVDARFDACFWDEYTVDAIVDDGSYCIFYIYEHDESLGRLYVYSDTMEGDELYNYVNELAKGKKVHVAERDRTYVMQQFRIFFILFYIMDLLVATVIAITIYAVVTGQYLNRCYEFGIYKALGIHAREIRRKITGEICLMNFFACVIGMVIIEIFTYLMNELVYIPSGKYLVSVSQSGIIGFLLCEVIILVPLIFSKGISMCKIDLTEIYK